MVLSNTLTMPSSCSVLAEEEMVYLDGGSSFIDIFNPSLWDINVLAENLVLAIGSFSVTTALTWSFSEIIKGTFGSSLGAFFCGTKDAAGAVATVGVFTDPVMFIAFTGCTLCVGYLALWQVDQFVKASQTQEAMQNPLKQ